MSTMEGNQNSFVSSRDLRRWPINGTMEITSINTSSRRLDLDLIQMAKPYSVARQYLAGEFIFHEGDTGNSMLLVLTGKVSVQKQVENTEEMVMLSYLGAGEFIGEMALVEELPRSATVVAETDCEVMEFSKESFIDSIQQEPRLAIQVLASLSGKLRDSDHYRILELEEKNCLLDASNKELTRLNDFLDCVIDQSPTAMFIATSTGALFRMNQAAIRLFDLTPDQTNQSINGLFADFRLSEFISSEASSWHGEVTAKGRAHQFPAYLSVASLSGDNETIMYLIICQDITELNAFNRTIQEFEKYTSVQQAAVELAHDMKNLLGVLFGNMELVLSRLTDAQREKSERAIGAIGKTSKDIMRFVENIMAYREDHAQFQLVDLKGVIESIIRFCQSQGVFQNIRISFEAKPASSYGLKVREGQIQSVLVNLMVNAAEALAGQTTNKDKQIKIVLSPSDETNLIRIDITDNGPGIDPDIIQKMFKTQITTKAEGHGIGLMSIKRIVESHGGEVAVESSLGEGSRFSVRLPSEQE